MKLGPLIIVVIEGGLEVARLLLKHLGRILLQTKEIVVFAYTKKKVFY